MLFLTLGAGTNRTVENRLPRLRTNQSIVKRKNQVSQRIFRSSLAAFSPLYCANNRSQASRRPDLIEVRQIRHTGADAVRALDSSIQGDDRSATWDTYVERLLSIIELDWLQYPPWGCFVAIDGSDLVGFLLSERQTTAYGLPPGARIVAMAVQSAKRRNGIGKMLVDALESQARSEGIEQIYSVLLAEDDRDSKFLESASFNASDLKIYSKQI
jgi:GNAT superfamily N-acetyltransferase